VAFPAPVAAFFASGSSKGCLLRACRRKACGGRNNPCRVAFKPEIHNEYLDDDELFHELIAAENDLIDDYVRGKLGPQEKPFEACFSCPEKRERVAFARSLMAYRPAFYFPSARRNVQFSHQSLLKRHFSQQLL
jgi:hypothetical protein